MRRFRKGSRNVFEAPLCPRRHARACGRGNSIAGRQLRRGAGLAACAHFRRRPRRRRRPQLNIAPSAPIAASPVDLATSAPRPPVQANAAPWELSAPKPAPDAADGDPASKSREGEIDLTALRYFAGQGDLARVAAEIRRLREKHPGWEPPQDLFGQSGNSEFEKPLWDLFAQHDYDGVRAGVEAIQDKNPGWQPSSDLMGKLALAEANDKLVKASDAQQWGDVIDIAAANKMLLTCGDVDAIWRTAEALAHTDDEPRALEAYRYILASCPKREERLATVQKASQILKSPEDLETLLRLGRRLPNGTSEFESVRFDLVRQKVGDAAAGKAGPEASQSEIDALAAHARNANDRGDQQLLGWLAYSRKDYVQAESWFAMALRPGPDPKAAEGLVLTLRGAGRIADAQKLAAQYAGLGPLNRKLMIEVLTASFNDSAATPLSPDDLVNLSQAIDMAKSADGAQLYAWHLYNSNDVAGAADWFRKSADWQPNEAAAIGQIVTARRLRDMRGYVDLVAKYRGVYPKVAALDAAMGRATATGGARHVGGGGWDKNADEIAKTMQAGNYEPGGRHARRAQEQRIGRAGGPDGRPRLGALPERRLGRRQEGLRQPAGETGGGRKRRVGPRHDPARRTACRVASIAAGSVMER